MELYLEFPTPILTQWQFKARDENFNDREKVYGWRSRREINQKLVQNGAMAK